MLRLGEVKVHILRDGGFGLDGGALFGIVPRVLWEKTHPPDAQNRVMLALNVALVETGGKRVLIDCGIGDKWSEKERRNFAIDRSTTLLAGLKKLGLGPEAIDVVVNTHLHFDHAGGNTVLQGERVVPAFPRARYVVQKGEWEDAMHPNERHRGSYREADFVPLAEARQLDLVQGEVEVAPGVRVAPVGGHTAYHQMIMVLGNGRRLVAPSDVLPMAAHLSLPYITAVDQFPAGTLEAKRRLLKQAAQEGWTFLFYHDGRTPLGKVREEKGRYVLDQVEP